MAITPKTESVQAVKKRRGDVVEFTQKDHGRLWKGLSDLVPLLVPMEEVHEWQKNPRHHTEKQIQNLRSSLSKFGQHTAIVVRSRDRLVIKGNGTLKAAKT